MARSPPPEGAAREGDLGLLVVGIVIGYLGSVMPTFGQVPAAARYVLMDLGLMLFMAGVGLNAGGGAAALASVGPLIVVERPSRRLATPVQELRPRQFADDRK